MEVQVYVLTPRIDPNNGIKPWFLHSNQRLMMSLLWSQFGGSTRGRIYTLWTFIMRNTSLWEMQHILTKNLKAINVLVLSLTNSQVSTFLINVELPHTLFLKFCNSHLLFINTLLKCESIHNVPPKAEAIYTCTIVDTFQRATSYPIRNCDTCESIPTDQGGHCG